MRFNVLHILGVLLRLLPLSIAFDIQGQILFDASLPNVSVPLGSRVTLDHGLTSALIRHDGSFSLYNVEDGEHVFHPHVPGYTFHSVFLTVTSPSIHCQLYHPARLPLSTSLPSLPHPLILTSTSKEEYYHQPMGMNILGLLKSPMVLMMIFSAVMLIGMPKLMANIDPDTAKEMAEARSKMQGVQNGDFMGTLSNMLAGTNNDEAAQAPAQAASLSNPSKNANGNGAGGKRRKGR